MAKKELDILDETSAVAEAGLHKAELFVQKNKQALLYAGGGLIAVVGLYFGAQEFVFKPMEEEAQSALYKAQNLFGADSVKAALNGRGEALGFLDIADEYSWTKAGNLAHYYAGLCYLDLAQPAEAIEELDQFSTNDGVLDITALGSIGDAFVELKQNEEAVEYYEKAAKGTDNEFLTPLFLRKAALVSEMEGNFSEALSFYQSIKEKYPLSSEGSTVDRDIAFCEAKLSTVK